MAAESGISGPGDGLPCVILAGGLSRRMGGGDKGLLQLAGRPILAHVIARLAPQCGPLALNANGDPARFAAFGLPVLPDTVPGLPGPLAGVLTAMDWANGLGADTVVTLTADTPFLPGDLVARLRAAGQGHAAIAENPDARGVARAHPTAGLWPVSLRKELADALAAGERRIGLWADTIGAERAPFAGTPHDPFFNINTPEDLAEAERIATLLQAVAPAPRRMR